MGQNCCKTIQPENTAPLLNDESSVTTPILVAEQAEHASIDSFVLSEEDNISAVNDVEDSEDNPLSDDNDDSKDIMKDDVEDEKEESMKESVNQDGLLFCE